MATAEIEAPCEQLWEILTDLEAYPEWNPFTRRVESTLELGDPVTLHIVLGGKAMTRVEWISRVEPGRKISWGMQMLHRGLLNANRHQVIEPLATNRARYTTRDELSGLLTPLVMALYGKAMQEGFEAVARALKARAEA